MGFFGMRGKRTCCHFIELVYQIALVLCPGQIVASGGEHSADTMLFEMVIVGELGNVVDSSP